MGLFNTSKFLNGNPSLISHISEVIANNFKNDGYNVMVENLGFGGREISITKGGMFKAILGMKTALKIELTPKDSGIQFDAKVGIFGLQAIPTVITLFVTWPVVLTQIWGMVQQSKLDDKALSIAELEIAKNCVSTTNTMLNYCPKCGQHTASDAKYCQHCGSLL